VLEKAQDIETDPRGVVLTGDALRSFWKLGMGKRFASIGHGKYIHRHFHDRQV
jgi:2-polyprenyl-6-methoxyphenol hydroxylase-like FAD-dependent oxidoreductase